MTIPFHSRTPQYRDLEAALLLVRTRLTDLQQACCHLPHPPTEGVERFRHSTTQLLVRWQTTPVTPARIQLPSLSSLTRSGATTPHVPASARRQGKGPWIRPSTPRKS